MVVLSKAQKRAAAYLAEKTNADFAAMDWLLDMRDKGVYNPVMRRLMAKGLAVRTDFGYAATPKLLALGKPPKGRATALHRGFNWVHPLAD